MADAVIKAQLISWEAYHETVAAYGAQVGLPVESNPDASAALGQHAEQHMVAMIAAELPR